MKEFVRGLTRQDRTVLQRGSENIFRIMLIGFKTAKSSLMFTLKGLEWFKTTMSQLMLL